VVSMVSRVIDHASSGFSGRSPRTLKIVSENCSVVVPPTLHVIFILTATPLFLLVAVDIGLEYNTAHSSVAGLLSRGCRQSWSVCVESVSNSRRQSTLSRDVGSSVVSRIE